MAEAGFEMLFPMLLAQMTPIAGVTRSVEVIRASTATTSRSTSTDRRHAAGPLPGVLHIHGGGMVMLEAAGRRLPALARRARRDRAWSSSASSSATAAASSGRTRSRPGSTTARRRCCGSRRTRPRSASQDRRVGRIGRRQPHAGHDAEGQARRPPRPDRRRVRPVPVHLERLRRRRLPELTSLFENDGYFLSCEQMGVLAQVYDPSRENATNPLAWPYHASRRRPRRAAAARHLGQRTRPAARRGPRLLPQAARLPACPVVSRTVNGTCHAGDCIFEAAMPDVYRRHHPRHQGLRRLALT